MFSLLNFSIERSVIPIRFKSSIYTLSALPISTETKSPDSRSFSIFFAFVSPIIFNFNKPLKPA